eukprot:1764921-Prymnesium_polylepis.1
MLGVDGIDGPLPRSARAPHPVRRRADQTEARGAAPRRKSSARAVARTGAAGAAPAGCGSGRGAGGVRWGA